MFSNDEIRTYFIDELEKARITCSCIVGETYVDKYVSEDYDYITQTSHTETPEKADNQAENR